MLIGVPKETKEHEYRIGLTPGSVRELTHRGHSVIVETDAGTAIGLTDPDYQNAGAEIVGSAEDIFSRAKMVVKVKEPQPIECAQLQDGQILFTYLHLAADRPQAESLLSRGVTAIAYETVTDSEGGLPLLAPMSEVAGRMSVQAGANALEMDTGGRGVLLGGVPGVTAANVVVIGGGVAGTNAARMAMGLEAKVTVLDNDLRRLYALDLQFGPTLNTIYSTVASIEDYVLQADLVIGAVLVPGGSTPCLVTEQMVKQMRRGSVLVDISIDQGGCFETSIPTSHSQPTYVRHEVVHYCVTNMPGAVARTSTFALNNATLPYTLALADKNVHKALCDDTHLRNGLNTMGGHLTHATVAEALNVDHKPASDALEL